MKLLIASHNKGKVAEFEKLLKPKGFDITSLIDYPELEEVEETGQTFEENARLKAEIIAKELNCLCLSDDSGLSVPILNGEPGVFSARYAGEPSDDQKNIDKLLSKLEGYHGEDRAAFFSTCIVLAYPGRDSLVVEGKVDGLIAYEEHGNNGFGYDPVFIYEPENKTFAELSSDQKNKISHRARAVVNLMREMPKWLEEIKE